MPESPRSIARNAVRELSRSLGTLAGTVWVCFVVGGFVVGTTDVSVGDDPVSGWLSLLAVLLVALVVGGWLHDGGYERFGADPDGGWTFVWLAALLLPLAFYPLRVALWFAAPGDLVPNVLFVLATTVTAGWLAFYDGLERLELSLDDFGRAFGYVVVLGAVPVGAVALFDVDWLTAAPVAAAVAIAVQIGACWLARR